MCNRLNTKSKNNYRVNDPKVALLTTFFVTLFSSGFYSAFLILSSIEFGSASTSHNPTSIPWINNQAACAQSGRTWSNDKCWDYEHNPLF
ncbi:MAG: hypothetical protein KME23_23985 [Goleter apudmare HA4340-LM2]|jgi:hypothetical protein|nr:hypothetical protein [Goleter apudmare HA4340-LM2]